MHSYKNLDQLVANDASAHRCLHMMPDYVQAMMRKSGEQFTTLDRLVDAARPYLRRESL